ncbi:MAG: fatty acid desaturase [Verrucomicrobiota bacterium]|nr:fatty acid desaturase [Verrucomicrobiota bacterium]
MFFIPALFLHGTVYSFLSFNGCGHELSHKTVFRSVRINEFFMKLSSFLSWTDYIGFRYSHIKHHQNTLYTDLDGEVTLPRPMPGAKRLVLDAHH